MVQYEACLNCHTARAAPSARVRGGMAERRGWSDCEVRSEPLFTALPMPLWMGPIRAIPRASHELPHHH
eukprot:6274175-Prymnesium_polylepis.1